MNSASLTDGIHAPSVVADTALVEAITAGSYLIVPLVTTTARNLLTATNGMIVYNTTDNKFQGYEAGAWANLI